MPDGGLASARKLDGDRRLKGDADKSKCPGPQNGHDRSRPNKYSEASAQCEVERYFSVLGLELKLDRIVWVRAAPQVQRLALQEDRHCRLRVSVFVRRRFVERNVRRIVVQRELLNGRAAFRADGAGLVAAPQAKLVLRRPCTARDWLVAVLAVHRDLPGRDVVVKYQRSFGGANG